MAGDELPGTRGCAATSELGRSGPLAGPWAAGAPAWSPCAGAATSLPASTLGPCEPAATTLTVLAGIVIAGIAAGDGLVGLGGGALSLDTAASTLRIAALAAEASAGGPAGAGVPVDVLERDSLTSFAPRERFFAKGLAFGVLPDGCLVVMPSRWLLKSATAGGLAPSDVTPVSETPTARATGEALPLVLAALAVRLACAGTVKVEATSAGMAVTPGPRRWTAWR